MFKGLKRLNKFENRILNLLKIGKGSVKLSQIGFSRKTENGFRFPIYSLEIGTESAIKKRPVGLISGVHGLETIGISVLLDFLEYILNPNSPGYMKEIKKGKVGIVSIPILNPGGVALNTRSNPAGVDLMRNSGVEAENPLIFFGGQKYSKKLPYFRGNILEPESKVLFRFIHKHFFGVKNEILPVLDIHSGFGTTDFVWWPFANTKVPTPDDLLYQKIANHLRLNCHHTRYAYEPQSKSYTTHGDLWDRFYLQYQKEYTNLNPKWNSKFLPWTLEIGTWEDLKSNPLKILKKRRIFNPSKESKPEFTTKHREFLKDFIRLVNLDRSTLNS